MRTSLSFALRVVAALLVTTSLLGAMTSTAQAANNGTETDAAPPAGESVQVVAKGSFDAVETAAHAVGAALIIDQRTNGALWLVERIEPVTGSEFDLAQHSELLAAELIQHAGVEWVTPAGRWVDADRFFAWRFFAWPENSPHLDIGTSLDSYLNLPAVHRRATGAGITVAVLDTGFDVNHPLLADRIVSGLDLIDGDTDVSDDRNGIDDDGDGKVDEAYGHGTHVAGIVAQTAPDASILPIRVLDADGLGEIHNVVEAIYQAEALGADIINISFGTGLHTQALEDAITNVQSQGVTVVAAAGNRGSDTAHYPAAFGGTVAVAAYDPTADGVADFSNHSDWVDVSALGINVLSAAPDAMFQSWSGSSMATPIAAGQLALIRQAAPELNASQAVETMRTTAHQGTSSRRTRYGQISYEAALTALLGTPSAERGCLGNQVWADADLDGFRDNDEVFVGDVTVELLSVDGVTVIKSTVTDSNGRYLLCDQPGEYRVRFVEPATGFDGFTVANAAREGRDSEAGSKGVTIDTFQIIDGTTNWQVDAGLVPGDSAPGPAIDLVKKIEGDDANDAPGPEFDVGETVEVTYDVTNTGNVDLVNVFVDDATVGIISCPADTLAVGETFQCSITETLTIAGAVFMEAEARGTYQSEIVRDNDPINFRVKAPPKVPPPPIVECGFSARAGVLSVITDQDPAFLDFEYLVHQGGESSPSLVLSVDDARIRLDFRGAYYELAWFGLQFTSFDVTVTPVHADSGSGSSPSSGPKTVCRIGSSPVGLDVDFSGVVERVDAVVEFDFDGDGSVEQAGEWFAPSEAILFDATIEGPLTGEHLFGDQGGRFDDGFAKLALRDVNNDGQVAGAELAGLGLWIDTNTNGVLDAGEQTSLAAHNIVSLSTNHTNMVSTAQLANGATMATEDLWFPITPVPATASQVLRNLGLSLLAAVAAAAVFVTRRNRRQRTLDAQLTNLLTTESITA